MLPDRLYLAGYHGDKEELADLIARNITAYDNEKQIIQYRWTPEKDTTEDAELAVNYGAAHGALAMTTPGDTTMASKKEVEAIMGGAGARVQR